MKQLSWLAILTLLVTGAALAGEEVREEKIKVMVMTDDAEVIDADVSDLAVGESRSFVTDSGKTVDVLRTTEGVELYIDGELQDFGFDGGGVHGEHVVVHKDVEVECFSDEEGGCEHEFVFINADGDYEYTHESGHESGHDVKVIQKRIEVICEDDGDCEDMVWISGDGEEVHTVGEGHKIIRIHKKSEDSD